MLPSPASAIQRPSGENASLAIDLCVVLGTSAKPLGCAAAEVGHRPKPTKHTANADHVRTCLVARSINCGIKVLPTTFLSYRLRKLLPRSSFSRMVQPLQICSRPFTRPSRERTREHAPLGKSTSARH